MFVLSFCLAAGAATVPDDVALPTPLDRSALVGAVLDRNPNLRAARAALDAADARRTVQGAWPDPMLSYNVAPLTIAGGIEQEVGVSVPIPLWGQRGAASDAARFDADAAAASYESVRRDLARMASMLEADWYVADRALALIDETLALLDQHRVAARTRYEAGRAMRQDVLEADAMAAAMRRDRITRLADRDVIVARINALLHRPSDAPVPPPPPSMSVPGTPPPDEARPELARAEAMIAAADAEARAARREAFPEIELMARYSTMWADPDERLMAGIEVGVPIAGRRAAVVEAEAKLAGARAERESVADGVGLELVEARRRFTEQIDIVAEEDQGVLPAARARMDAARAAFEGGIDDLRPLIDAHHDLLQAELDREEALAEAWRRYATLEYASGAVPGLAGGAS